MVKVANIQSLYAHKNLTLIWDKASKITIIFLKTKIYWTINIMCVVCINYTESSHNVMKSVLFLILSYQ